MTHTVREAADDDAGSVVRLLDAAMLSFDRERARKRVRGGDALVAVVRGHNREERRAGADAGEDRVIGVCILGRAGDSTEIEQIAVHRSRRGRGVGTTLVEAAATRTDGPLVARFREGVRPFYESLGFEIEAAGDSEARRGEKASDSGSGDGRKAGDGDGVHSDERGGPADDRLRGILR